MTVEQKALRPAEVSRARRGAEVAYVDMEHSLTVVQPTPESDKLLLLPPEEEAFFSDGRARSVANYNKLLRVQGAHGRLDLAVRTYGDMARPEPSPRPALCGAHS